MITEEVDGIEETGSFPEDHLHAAVLVTEGDRRAIAIWYEDWTVRVPRVVTKGIGREAHVLQLRASRSEVPIIECDKLAAALFEIEPGEKIPVQLYPSLAEVLAIVYKMQKSAEPAKSPVSDDNVAMESLSVPGERTEPRRSET